MTGFELKSLRVMVPLLLLVVALLICAFTLGYNIQLSNDRVEAESLTHVTQHMTELQGILETFSLKGDTDNIQKTISNRGSEENVEVLALVNENGNVSGATSLALVGHPVKTALPGADARITNHVTDTMTGQVFLSDDGSAIYGYYPVLFGTKTGELRPSRVGLLYMRYDLGSLKASATSAILYQTLLTATFYILLFIFLAVFLHFTVTRRAERLVNVAGRFSEGDLTARSGFGGNDELSKIGRAFDHMADKIVQDSESLRSNEQKFRDIFNNTTDAIEIHEIREDGTPGKFFDVNDVACRMLGYSREEMLDKSPLDIITDYHNPPLEKTFEEQRTTGSARFETEQRRKDGTIIPVEVNTHVVTLLGKKVMLGVVRDITERKSAEGRIMELLQFQKSALMNANVLLFVIDCKGIVKIWNTAAEEITGYTAGEVVGGDRIWKHLYPEDKYRRQITDKINCIIEDHSFLENLETTLRCKNGDEKIIAWNTRVITDPAGNATGYIAIGIDVTTRKKSEDLLRRFNEELEQQVKTRTEELHNSRGKYRDLIENLNDVIFSIGLEGIFTYISPVIERLYGYTPGEVTGQHFMNFIHPDDRAHIFEGFRRQLTGTYVPDEFRILAKDGTAHHVLVSPRPIEKEGSIVGFNYVMTDITARREAEEKLKSERKQLLSLFNSLDEIIYVCDLYTYEILYVNDAFLRSFKKNPVGGICYQEFQGFDKPCEFCTNKILLKDKDKPCRWEYHNPVVGRDFDVVDRIITWSDGREVRFEFAKDITERKRAEESERLTRERFETLMNVSEMRDASELELSEYVMQAACRMTGSTLAFIGTMTSDESVMDIISWSSSAMQDCMVAVSPIHFPIEKAGIWADAVRTQKPIIVNDYAAPYPGKKGLPEGHVRITRFLSFPILDKEKVVMVAAVANKSEDYNNTDVTQLALLMQSVWGNLQKRRSEEALKESEEKFRDIFNNTTDAIHIHGIGDDGTPGKFTDVNNVACQMLGYTREEMLAKTPLEISTGYHNPLIERVFEEQRTTGTARFETKHRAKDGTIIPVEVNTHVVSILGKNVMLGVVRDITERKKAEDLLKHFNEELEQEVKVRTEELNASLDEKVILLREVHHRVKNNLQIIISLVNLQMRQIDDKRLKQVMAETQNRVRAMSFVHEKLYQSEDISHIDIANYTRFLVTQLFSFYGVDSRQVVLNIDIGKIMIDINTAIPLGLIINELASNALKYAYPNGRTGTLSITVREVEKTLYLSVKDDGVGVPADFDWRNAESLGLRLVISLVDQLDGTIELDRTSGTAFTIVVQEKE